MTDPGTTPGTTPASTRPVTDLPAAELSAADLTRAELSVWTLETALGCAGRGWPVFPLVPGGKEPAVKGWPTVASTHPRVLHQWWRRSAGAPCGLGIACGPAGLVVVDLDHKPPLGVTARAGFDHLRALGPLPRTLTVRTPSGGWHLYYAHPGPTHGWDGPALRNTAGHLAAGIDTRAHGGYVAAPPTRLPHGAYRATGDSDTVAVLPLWLARRLAPQTPPPPPAQNPTQVPIPRGAGSRLDAYLAAAVDREVARVTGARPGSRNHALFVAAVALGQLVAGGALPADAVVETLEHAAAGHVLAGAYTPGQARATITSGLRAGARRPRSLNHVRGSAA